MKLITEQKKIQHLFWRAGFGPSFSLLENTINFSVKTEIEKLFADSKNFEPLFVEFENYPTKRQMALMDKTQRKEERRKEMQSLFGLNSDWLNRMADGNQMLREKMTFFWSGHFACRINDIRFTTSLNNVIRKNALGNFGDLLIAVSKEPAMILFLNNRQNRKQHPNENFAREVMELFTLGHGNYSELDVKEVARAFTGWEFDMDGKFKLFDKFHDENTKIILGEKGNFDGDAALKIILSQKKCAYFITQKIYKFFVNDDLDEKIINQLSEKFYASGYNIEKLMHEIFSSDWFYNEKNIGSKIKSPVELLAGMINNFDLKFKDSKSLIPYQRVLGQVLFFPPNVAGWPGGKNWIDNSTLMIRLMLAKRFLTGAPVDIHPKEEYDMQMMQLDKMEKMENKIENNNARMLPLGSWTACLDASKETNEIDLVEKMITFFIQPSIEKSNVELFKNFYSTGNKSEKIKSIAVNILGLPEYQMC